MLRNTLQFFDSKGDNLNLSFDATKDCWVGTLFFPKTSIDIISLQQVLVFSKANYLSNPKLVKPLSRFDLELKFSLLDLEDSDNEDFYFYDKNQDSFIDLKKEKSINLSSSNFTYDYENNIANLIELEEDPSVFSVIFKPNEKKNSSTIMKVSYLDSETNKEIKILELFLYGEGVEEDERFPIVMNNLGLDLDITNDIQVFKNVNPKEPLNDWEKLNTKRKELLFSYDQIIPFTGTYKGMVNAIKYYGYNNINIKEWWKNLDPNSEFFGKYKSILIDEQPPEQKFWKKTGLFTLVYNLNSVNYDNVGVDGLPIVTEEFDFSSEEILNKLTLLRDKIERHHSPVFSKIVDVVGEATYFTKLNLNVWFTNTKIEFVKDKNINFDVDIEYSYINDLREFGTSPPWNSMTYPGNIQGDYFLGQLRNLNITNLDRIHDKENASIGADFTLKLNLSPTFKDLENFRIIKLSNIKIKDLQYLFFHTVRWSIFNSSDERVYYNEGDIRDISTIKVTLRKEDIYTVKVEVIDRYNHILNRIKPNLINLKSKEVEFLGFYENETDKLKIKDFIGRKIKSMNFQFNNAKLDTDRFKFRDLNIRLKSLRKLEYWKSEKLVPVKLSDIKIPISEMKGKKLKFFNYKVPLNVHFKILNMDHTNTQQIYFGDTQINFSGLSSSTDYLRMANIINNYFKNREWVANPLENSFGGYDGVIVVNKFKKVYDIDKLSWSNGVNLEPLPMIKRFHSSDSNFTVKILNSKPGDYYIDSNLGKVDIYELSQTQGNSFDINFNNTNVLFSFNSQWSLISEKSGFIKNYTPIDFRINNLKWFEFNTEVNRFTRIYFSLDKTKIKGIIEKKWILTKENSQFSKEFLNKNVIHYLFIDRGIYNLTLEIIDNQGNKKQITKKEIVKVI